MAFRRRIATTLVIGTLALSALAAVLEWKDAMPLALRNHPLALVVVALLFGAGAVGAARPPVRSRAAALAPAVVALVCALAAGYVVHRKYRLPVASASALIGDPLPVGSLVTDAGVRLPLADLRGRPTVVVWLRGSWCPYCRKQLVDLARVAGDYADAVRIVAVTSEEPEPLAAVKSELGLPFTLLSDPNGVLTSRCELAHCVAITDSAGVVRWGVLSGNWDRLSSEALLQRAFDTR